MNVCVYVHWALNQIGQIYKMIAKSFTNILILCYVSMWFKCK